MRNLATDLSQPEFVRYSINSSRCLWRGFYRPQNPATLEGGFHLWPISISNKPKPWIHPLFREDWQQQWELNQLQAEVAELQEARRNEEFNRMYNLP